jgi:hypothetical protein
MLNVIISKAIPASRVAPCIRPGITLDENHGRVFAPHSGRPTHNEFEYPESGIT